MKREGEAGLMKTIENSANQSQYPISKSLRNRHPLPLYSGGEGRGEGVQHPSIVHDVSARDTVPLTPGPSPPEYRGRGEKRATEIE